MNVNLTLKVKSNNPDKRLVNFIIFIHLKIISYHRNQYYVVIIIISSYPVLVFMVLRLSRTPG